MNPKAQELVDRWNKKSEDYARLADKCYADGDEDDRANTYVLLSDCHRMHALALTRAQIP